MADFSALKTSIQNYIKQNGNKEITGNLLQQILLSMVSTLGDSAINDLVAALNAEIANRGNADTTLQGNIDNEATARGNADTELGGRITTLQGVINGIVANVENGYVYAGIATPSSTPASGKVFYLALTAGTYTNFGATVVPQGINILKYNGSAWSLDSFLGLDDAPTQGSGHLVKSGGVLDSIIKDGSAFDLSAYNNGTTYADLSAALTALNALPAVYKKGGMSVKYVQTSDNKYIQYRLMSDTFNTTPSNWQGVDDVPTAGSKNIVESGGVYNKLLYINTNLTRTTWNNGFYDNVNGVATFTSHQGLQSATYTLDNDKGKVAISNANKGPYSGALLYMFVDNDMNILSSGSDNATVDIPSGAIYLIINSIPSVKDDIVVKYFLSTNEKVEGLEEKIGYPTISGVWEDGFYYNDKSVISNDSFVHTSFDVEVGYTKLKVTLDITASSSLNCFLLDAEGNTIENWKNVRKENAIIDLTSFETPVKKILLSSAKNIAYSAELIPNTSDATSLFEQAEKDIKSAICNRVVYVDGSYTGGSNDGSIEKPYTTIKNAINAKYEKGCCLKIYVKAGQYLNDFGIVLSSLADGELQILNYGDGKVLCGRRYAIINNGNETLVSGKEKTYQISINNDLLSQVGCLWQYGYAYGEISINKRHPLQRGYSHRLNSTPIVMCSSDNVSDAIAEIENADGYKFFYDSANHVLYFSRPQSSSTYNIILPRPYDAFIVGSRNVKLTLCGIDIEFCALSLDYCNLVNISDCSIRYANARGGLRLDHCRNSVITRVEVAGTYQGITTMGDGINIHSDMMGTISDEEQRTTNTIIDCWCHDNNDDGYSDHEGCQTTIIGGLFEYNKKGGCTPSTGAVDTIYNAISRNNYNGFYYINNPSDGGVGGQMILFNCLAENNSESGFRVATNANNVATLINCSSIGNAVGYKRENGVLKAIGCTTLNDTVAKDGTITIETPSALI